MLEELIDRFGDPPKPVENLLYIAKIKSLAHEVYMTEISQKADTVKFTLYGKAKLDVAKIPEFIASYGNNLKFTMDASRILLRKTRRIYEGEEIYNTARKRCFSSIYVSGMWRHK